MAFEIDQTLLENGYRGGYAWYHEAVKLLSERGVYSPVMVDKETEDQESDRLVHPLPEGSHEDVYYEYRDDHYVVSKEDADNVFVSPVWGLSFSSFGESGLMSLAVDAFGQVVAQTIRRTRNGKRVVTERGHQQKETFLLREENRGWCEHLSERQSVRASSSVPRTKRRSEISGNKESGANISMARKRYVRR